MTDWDDIAGAVALVRCGKVRRIDGNGFKVYTVPGGVTRIDLPPEEDDNESNDRDPVELRQGS